MQRTHSIIVGAGWAGLSCAIKLTQLGHKVTVIESAPQSGGRARSVEFGTETIDNGQHICLGAYKNLRSLLKLMSVPEKSIFKKMPLKLSILGKSKLKLTIPFMPAPLHLLWGLISTANLSVSEKYQALKFCYYLQKNNFTLEQDCTIDALLKKHKQSKNIIKHLWEPIALAVMTTPITLASAQVFINVLKISFTQKYSDSNWLFPTKDLSKIIPLHAENYIKQHGGEIVYCQNIKEIILNGNICTSVISNTKSWSGDNIILAIPPWRAAKIVAPHSLLQSLHTQLEQFEYQPITTCYFKYAAPINLGYPMTGLVETTTQWIFDREFANQPNILSAVISGNIENKRDKPSLIELISQEVLDFFPHLPTPIDHKLITEKRAAFSCTPHIQKHRPDESTALKNLWLAGDYLQNGLPSTLEGAVLSGIKTAKMVSPRSLQNF